MRYRNLEERLLANTVEVDNGFKIDGVVSPCWEWIGNANYKGYPRFARRQGRKVKKVAAHRAAFELFTGSKLDPEKTLNHKCLIKRCIHPNHLEIMTRAENTQEMNARVKQKKVDFQRAFAKLGLMA